MEHEKPLKTARPNLKRIIPAIGIHTCFCVLSGYWLMSNDQILSSFGLFNLVVQAAGLFAFCNWCFYDGAFQSLRTYMENVTTEEERKNEN